LTQITEIPIGMFVGNEDLLGDPKDARETRDQIGSIVHYEEIEGGHMSFLAGKDMSYFERVLDLLSTYNKGTE
jgi:surfactin synthase thioesterase subunit